MGLVVISGTTILAPYLEVKSLHLIRRLGTGRFHLRVSGIQGRHGPLDMHSKKCAENSRASVFENRYIEPLSFRVNLLAATDMTTPVPVNTEKISHESTWDEWYDHNKTKHNRTLRMFYGENCSYEELPLHSLVSRSILICTIRAPNNSNIKAGDYHLKLHRKSRDQGRSHIINTSNFAGETPYTRAGLRHRDSCWCLGAQASSATIMLTWLWLAVIWTYITQLTYRLITVFRYPPPPHHTTMKPKSCHDANFVVNDGTGGCRDDNLPCRQY